LDECKYINKILNFTVHILSQRNDLTVVTFYHQTQPLVLFRDVRNLSFLQDVFPQVTFTPTSLTFSQVQPKRKLILFLSAINT